MKGTGKKPEKSLFFRNGYFGIKLFVLTYSIIQEVESGKKAD
jgi:hypothetical protein